SGAVVIRAGLSRFGQPTPFRGVNPNDLKLSSRDTAGKLSAFEYVGVQKTGPGYHAHPNQDEVFYVVSGEYIFQVGPDKQLLKAGDLIFLPRNAPHTWVQVSERGQLFYFLQPAGKMEEFFLKMTESGGKSSPEEMKRINAEHGIVPYGPPISAEGPHTLSESVQQGFVLRAGKSRSGEAVKINGLSPNDVKVSGSDTNGELSIFEYSGNELGGPPLHVHPQQDEVFYLTEGRYLFQCGEERFTLEAGDMIFLPRNVPHTWAQLTPSGKMLFFFQPAGKMEAFFSTLGKMSGPPASPEAGAKLFTDHDMQVVGPPLKY
ncbi:MAG: cupin domain-containing protein, partial [Bacteroidetes bacterium]